MPIYSIRSRRNGNSIDTINETNINNISIILFSFVRTFVFFRESVKLDQSNKSGAAKKKKRKKILTTTTRICKFVVELLVIE